nr:hypothetical protein Iba_chr14cCG7070 [Ipomoea batatas]
MGCVIAGCYCFYFYYFYFQKLGLRGCEIKHLAIAGCCSSGNAVASCSTYTDHRRRSPRSQPFTPRRSLPPSTAGRSHVLPGAVMSRIPPSQSRRRPAQIDQLDRDVFRNKSAEDLTRWFCPGSHSLYGLFFW